MHAHVREIEKHGGGEKPQGQIFVYKRQENCQEGKKCRNKNTNCATVDFLTAHLNIFNVFGFEDVSSNPEKAETNDYGVDAENNYCELVVVVSAQEGSRKWNEGDEEKENSIDVRQISINIFCIN